MSVRTLIYCARSEPNLARVPEIAKAFGVTDMYLFKIILPVVKNGLIDTIRGRRGGIRLARPAEQIRLSDVLRITEDGGFALAESMEVGGRDYPYQDDIRYTAALERGLQAFFAVMDDYTIAELAASHMQVAAVGDA
jgi:Rrf2 family iron-responsive transcriptional regulator